MFLAAHTPRPCRPRSRACARAGNGLAKIAPAAITIRGYYTGSSSNEALASTAVRRDLGFDAIAADEEVLREVLGEISPVLACV